MAEVGFHISESDDFVTEVAFCCAAAVDEFVRGEAGEEDFGVEDVGVGVAFLWDDEVAELAEDEFSGADGRAVLG